MSVPCDDLDSFFDGELSKERADTFRMHLATCERCQAALRGMMQEAVVAEAGHERAEQPRVSAAKPTHLGARRRMIVALVPLLAVAAAFVIWFVGTHEQALAKPMEVSLTIEHHGDARRGSLAHVGDVLRPMVHGERHRAIWVYLGGDLVIACPGNAQCSSTDNELTLKLRVTAPGQYSIIALGSAEPIMAPHGALDVMLSAATASGAHFETRIIAVN